MGKRVDLGGLAIDLNFANTGQGVATSDVHGAGTANTLTARTTEGQGGINLVLDLDQGIENHGTTVVHINLVRLKLGLYSRSIRVLKKSSNWSSRISEGSLVGDVCRECVRGVWVES